MLRKDDMAKEKTEAKEKKTSGLVAMTCSEEDAKGGPVTADVHPDEVENFKLAGWKVE